MEGPVRILAFAGSLRRGSFNRAALRAAEGLLPPGASLEIFDLEGIPAYNQDHEQEMPARVREFKERIRAADAILIATPEYNYSVPKNAIDWASRPYGDSAWNGKPVAILGASPGMLGTARAQYHLRQMFIFLNMYPLNQPEIMIANAAERFDEQGNLNHEPTRAIIRKQLAALADWTRQLASARSR
jgi:chromate reductase, NAD(P)H dehydrogenase (quinone)